MSNKKILQGHNKALESLATIAGIPIKEVSMFGENAYYEAEFTYASETDFSELGTINHNLGVMPKLIIIFAKNIAGLKNGDFIVNASVINKHGSAIDLALGTISSGESWWSFPNGGNNRVSWQNVSETSVTAKRLGNQTDGFSAGVTYKIIIVG